MPRVSTHTSQGRSKTAVRCAKCSDPIVKGEEYYKWAIKSQRGGTVYHQHTKHGAVRQSQLTHSKMSGVYAAIEACEDLLGGASESSEVAEALRSCASDVESVRDEYQESLDNMPEQLQQGDTGQQIQEKIEQLETYAQNLNDCADEIDNEEPEEIEQEDGEADEDFETRKESIVDDFLQEMTSKAEEVLGDTEF